MKTHYAQVYAPPAARLLARRDFTSLVVADHLLGPALPVLLAATAPQQARYADVAVALRRIGRLYFHAY
jgi:hypothetical protein